MRTRWKRGLSLAVTAATSIVLVLVARSNACLWRRVSGSASQCLPGNPRQFDPYVDGKTLVARLCGEQFTELRYLHACGIWVNGSLDALAADSRTEIVAASGDTQRCTITVSEGFARRTETQGHYTSRWAWPECATRALWNHARISGFKLSERACLNFDSADGVAIGSTDDASVHWTLKLGDPCTVSMAAFVDSLVLWSASPLAESLFESAQQGHPLLTTLAAAQRGCRSPKDNGCARCCVSTRGVCNVCQALSYLPNAYICSTSAKGIPCPTTCPRCAQCSTYDEAKLRAAPSRPECDCRVAILGDACFDLKSCDCYCRRLGPSLASCPGLL
jgi:hypothetical protein